MFTGPTRSPRRLWPSGSAFAGLGKKSMLFLGLMDMQVQADGILHILLAHDSPQLVFFARCSGAKLQLAQH